MSSRIATSGSTRAADIPRFRRGRRRTPSFGSSAADPGEGAPPPPTYPSARSRSVASGSTAAAADGAGWRSAASSARRRSAVRDRLVADMVDRLPRVVLQIVQFRMRGLDQFCRRRPPGMERRPPQLELRVERLGIGRRVAHGLPLGGRTKRAAVEIGPAGKAGVVEQRRQHVDRPRHGVRDAAGGQARSGHDPRHAQRGVVEEHAVGPFAVLAETLAVVGRHEDERAAAFPVSRRAPAAAGRAPGPRTRSRRRTASRGSRSARSPGRLVRRMRIVIVHPEKPAPRLAVGRIQPAERRVGRGIRGPLHVRRPAGVVAARQVILGTRRSRDRTRTAGRAESLKSPRPSGSRPAGSPRPPS